MKISQIGSLDDDLRPEYDLGSLLLRGMCPGRSTADSSVVRLAPDVVEMFPNSQAVNEALRFLIRAAREKAPNPG